MLGPELFRQLPGDIFRRIIRSAEIIFGGDIFRHHFTQILAFISAEYFWTIKFALHALNRFTKINAFVIILRKLTILLIFIGHYDDPFSVDC